jgi:hypothetical protein
VLSTNTLAYCAKKVLNFDGERKKIENQNFPLTFQPHPTNGASFLFPSNKMPKNEIKIQYFELTLQL